MGVWIDPEIRSSYLPEVEVDLRHPTTKEHARRLWGAMQSDLWQEMLQADARARSDDGYEGHTDGVVAIDQWGNLAALTYTSNTNAWGGTGMFVDGVFIPDPGALYQKPMAQVIPGQRLPIALNPLIVLEDGEPVFASAAAGATIQWDNPSSNSIRRRAGFCGPTGSVYRSIWRQADCKVASLPLPAGWRKDIEIRPVSGATSRSPLSDEDELCHLYAADRREAW